MNVMLDRIEDRGSAKQLISYIENIQENLKLSLEESLAIVGETKESYEKAKSLLARQ